MGQKTLFQLLVKAVAVLAIAVAVPAIIRMVGNLGMITNIGGGWGPGTSLPMALTWLFEGLAPHSAMLAAGLHLLLTDRLVERFAFPRPDGHCTQCGSPCQLDSECSHCGTVNEGERRMTPRTYFETVIRAIGLAICVLAIPQIVQLAGGILGTILGPTRLPPLQTSQWEMSLWVILQCVATIVQVCIGIYLLRGGKWIVTFLYPIDGMICARCGWNLERTTGDDCPECGAAIATNATAITR